MRETLLIAELLKKGEWFGNYAVGTHGFIFKLPLALVYIFTGPNTYLATIYNSLITLAAFFLFHKILIRHFKFPALINILANLLFLTSNQLVTSTFLFLREPSVLLATLIFIYLILEKKNHLLLGLSLLLVLDAKEYVALVLGCGYALALLLEKLIVIKLSKLTLTIKEIFFSCVALFLPSFLWLVLMFFTSVIPVNTYAAFAFGLINEGFEPQVEQITTGNENNILLNTASAIDSTYKTTAGQMALINFVSNIKDTGVGTLIKYFIKPLYPRTFGFLSIPLAIMIPAAYLAFLSAKDNIKKDSRLAKLAIIFLFYTFIYILYYSHGRYILPMMPLAILYFLQFWTQLRAGSARLIYIAALLVPLSALFEVTYTQEKWILNLLTGLILLIYYYFRNHKLNHQYALFALPVIFLCLVSFSTSLTYLYSFGVGQIKKSLIWGRDEQSNQISQVVDRKSKILFNGNPYLLALYRYDLSQKPEAEWSLSKHLPKKYLLREIGSTTAPYPHNMACEDIINYSKNNGFDYIFTLNSVFNEYKFKREECLGVFSQNLKLYRSLDLKGKTLFVFSVI